MSSKRPEPKTTRIYNRANCIACYAPNEVTGRHDLTFEHLDKKHLQTKSHRFITTIQKDRILSKVKPQKNQNQSDIYYYQREEYTRTRKLDYKKQWLDYIYHEESKQYNYCNYCVDFILDENLNQHEKRNTHWQKFQSQFMNDLKDLLSKSNTKLDKFFFAFTQKYAATKQKDARDFFGRHLNQMSHRTSDSANEHDDSGIELLCASTSFDCNQDIVASTPKKSEKKTKSPKKKVYVKDLHTSSEIYKVSHKDAIRMYYQNTNSVLSDEKKKNFVATSVCSYDVIMFTETWLKEEQSLEHNMNVFNEDYDVYRRDRSKTRKSRGGGVLVAVSAKLYNDRVYLKNYNHLEYVCVQFLNDNKSIFLYCAYIAPDSLIDTYEEHFTAIQSIRMSKDDILIVVGDFNLPKIVWHSKDSITFLPENNDSTRVTRSQATKLAKLKEFQSKWNLHQRNLHQLCNYQNPKKNVLDLVFTNDIDHISIGKLPDSQEPMSKADERHAPPFEIFFNSIKQEKF